MNSTDSTSVIQGQSAYILGLWTGAVTGISGAARNIDLQLEKAEASTALKFYFSAALAEEAARRVLENDETHQAWKNERQDLYEKHKDKPTERMDVLENLMEARLRKFTAKHLKQWGHKEYSVLWGKCTLIAGEMYRTGQNEAFGLGLI